MKNYISPGIRLTLVLLVILSIVYPLVIAGVARLAPGQGKGETVTVNGKVVGYALVGQKFAEDRYFNSRPSAVEYKADGSGGSNKGPSNPDYLKTVQARIDTFLVHNPGINKIDIPTELVTASGSGLDPDLSPAATRVQVARIAKIRGISTERLNQLVDEYTRGPLIGLFGPSTVNVLKLNVALDAIK
ncbi:K(+)-transporting ATPase subunit C [Spirosoma sp.]|uniref:K(+)-transporting ATPase subunit C n=1 Tax=Spirosoma sp. TaxID=1899569 RepID=UPI00260690A8|nr:K(+)-transporting ATPase subunit C [Spirosoma sp.]MCX6218699.1 K(+)-transporting ATPase subunit C [Spirosoma sp.]